MRFSGGCVTILLLLGFLDYCVVGLANGGVCTNAIIRFDTRGNEHAHGHTHIKTSHLKNLFNIHL